MLLWGDQFETSKHFIFHVFSVSSSVAGGFFSQIDNRRHKRCRLFGYERIRALALLSRHLRTPLPPPQDRTEAPATALQQSDLVTFLINISGKWSRPSCGAVVQQGRSWVAIGGKPPQEGHAPEGPKTIGEPHEVGARESEIEDLKSEIDRWRAAFRKPAVVVK